MMGDQSTARAGLRTVDKVVGAALIILSLVLFSESLHGLSAGVKYVVFTIPLTVLMAFVCASTIFIVIRRFRANDRDIFPPQPKSWMEQLVISTLGLPVFVAALAMGILLVLGQHSTLIGRAMGAGLLLGVTVGIRATLRVIRQAYYLWRTNANYPATRREAITRLRQRRLP
jgi:predicted Co/Zn/Cd cation transporter (cation efflux family)